MATRKVNTIAAARAKLQVFGENRQRLRGIDLRGKLRKVSARRVNDPGNRVSVTLSDPVNGSVANYGTATCNRVTSRHIKVVINRG